MDGNCCTLLELTTWVISSSSEQVTSSRPLPGVKRISGFACCCDFLAAHLRSPGMLPGGMVPVSATGVTVLIFAATKAPTPTCLLDPLFPCGGESLLGGVGHGDHFGGLGEVGQVLQVVGNRQGNL